MATAVTTCQSSSFWASVREALRGSHQDYTTGSLTRAIFLLAVPMVLEMLMESLFAIVDVFWVARLGAESVATMGLVEALLTVMYAVGMGVGLSATAMVARRVGEKDRDGAAVAGVQAITLGLLVGLSMGAPCLYFAPHLLRLMGASPSVLAVGASYARIALGGCGVVLLLFLNNAVFRGAGDAAVAMRVLWLSNSINLLLDPCLIFGLGPFPRLGVTGAAVATLTGRSMGVVYQFCRLSRGGKHIRILARQVRIQAEVMMQAFNGAGDTLTPTIVNFFGFIVLEIPLAYALAIPLGMHSNGVYWAITVSESAIAVAMVLLFRRGRSKEKKI